MSTVDLAFEEFGSSSNAPVIVLHGFFASSRNWRQVAEKLAVSFHVYSLDLRNHGSSPHHPVMNYPAMTADLLHFMDEKGLTTASLLGHSMGGKVAMWFALNYPDRVDKLLVVDIAPVSYTHCFNDLIGALQKLPLSEITNRKQAELWLAPYIQELSYRQFLLQNLVLKDGKYCLRIDLDIFCHAGPDIIAFPCLKSVKPFNGKVLFLAGAQSSFVKAEDLIEAFPKALLIEIQGAGHWVHVQQQTKFLEQVEKFLT
jgi:pimeloyl-ACP methyl ester carboxylesterase